MSQAREFKAGLSHYRNNVRPTIATTLRRNLVRRN
jgi:hypothetical protein